MELCAASLVQMFSTSKKVGYRSRTPAQVGSARRARCFLVFTVLQAMFRCMQRGVGSSSSICCCFSVQGSVRSCSRQGVTGLGIGVYSWGAGMFRSTCCCLKFRGPSRPQSRPYMVTGFCLLCPEVPSWALQHGVSATSMAGPTLGSVCCVNPNGQVVCHHHYVLHVGGACYPRHAYDLPASQQATACHSALYMVLCRGCGLCWVSWAPMQCCHSTAVVDNACGAVSVPQVSC